MRSRELKNKLLEYWPLLLITLFGLCIRLWGYARERIWIDESVTVQVAANSLAYIRHFADPTPPLHTLILHCWFKFFAPTVESARLLSVIVGVACIIATYFLAKLLFDRKSAIVASILLATSSFHILFSQEARAYIFLVLFSIFSSIYFIRYCREQSVYNSIGWIISAILLMYTHYFSVYFLVVQSMVYVIWKIFEKDWKSILVWVAQGVVAIGFVLPYVIATWEIIISTASNHWISTVPFWRNLIRLWWQLHGTYTVGLVFLVTLIGGLWYLFRREKSQELSYLYAMFIGPIVLFILQWLLFGRSMVPRYLIYIVVPFIVVNAYVIARARKWLVVAIVAVIVIANAMPIEVHHNNLERPEWDKVAAQIEAQPLPVLVEPYYQRQPLLYYLDRECFSEESWRDCADQQELYDNSEYIEDNFILVSALEVPGTISYDRDGYDLVNTIHIGIVRIDTYVQNT